MALVKHTNLRDLPVGVEHIIFFEGMPAGLLTLEPNMEIVGGIDPILNLAIVSGCEVFLERVDNIDRKLDGHESFVRVTINPPGTHSGNVE